MVLNVIRLTEAWTSMPDDKKTYFHIVSMTEKFRETFKLGPGGGDITEHAFRYWQLSIMLAQAQQLSVISTQLQEIREAFLTAAGKK